MKSIDFYLIPEPGKQPEFLTTVIPVDPSPVALQHWQALIQEGNNNHNNNKNKLVLEAYTRESWAWKPHPVWQSITVQSTDGRNKLPGFVKYLKERQKSVYGRMPLSSSSSSVSSRTLLVVSYVQGKQQSSSSSSEMTSIECRVTMDFANVPNCSLQPLAIAKPQTQSQQQQPSLSSSSSSLPPAKKTGLLGKLVSGAQRTQQTIRATAKPAAASSTSSNPNNESLSPGSTDNQQQASSSSSSSAPQQLRTAQQVLTDFREQMQQKMLDFELASHQDTMQLPIVLAHYTNNLLVSSEDNDNFRNSITMDVLKYMVYEAAEEVNDEWVVFKEPSEFMDECVFSIYKEGAAPPEVLEDINKAELPEEVRGQERALAAERQKQVERQQLHEQKLAQQQAHRQQLEEEEDDLEVLNTQKRDRRTIADYEREKRSKIDK